MGKGPKPPDPMQTANAQSQMNRNTAITQYQLGATNQKTPYGTSSYRQIGTWPDGTPRFEQTMSFSPEQQGLYNKFTGLQNKLSDLGNRDPFKLGNAETESRLFSLGRAQLDPRYAEARAGLETKLVNSGIRRGTQAWESAMREFGDQESRQYNDLLLSGRAQAANESLTERNQPLSELIAILSGSQPNQPQFQQTPQPGVAGVDYAGLVNQNYQNQLQRQANSPLNSLFRLGSSFALGGWQ